MLKALLRHLKPEPQARIDIIFLDEPEEDRDEVNTFTRAPVVPRVGPPALRNIGATQHGQALG